MVSRWIDVGKLIEWVGDSVGLYPATRDSQLGRKRLRGSEGWMNSRGNCGFRAWRSSVRRRKRSCCSAFSAASGLLLGSHHPWQKSTWNRRRQLSPTQGPVHGLLSLPCVNRVTFRILVAGTAKTVPCVCTRLGRLRTETGQRASTVQRGPGRAVLRRRPRRRWPS